MKKIISYGQFLLFFISLVTLFSIHSSQLQDCISGSFTIAAEATEWYARATLTLKNSCTHDLSLKDVKISLTSQDLKGNPINLGTFVNWWVNGSPYNIVFTEDRKTPSLQSGIITAEKIDQPLIKANQTIHLTGDVNLKGSPYDVTIAMKTLSINGQIQKIVTPLLSQQPTAEKKPEEPFTQKLPKMLPVTIKDLGYKGEIIYHVEFPFDVRHPQPQAEKFPIEARYIDLLLSNIVAGSLLEYLINKHNPLLRFNREYIIGTLFAQLLQENLDTTKYDPSTQWINPDIGIRTMLLASGQGGPYQINDYSKRLENKLGMINFVALQKSLGYSVEDQDSGKQTASVGPETLDDKYFGPIAAAYFQFNDLLRLEAINEPTWGPSPDFKDCIENLKKTQTNLFDMILNATYNAGPWSSINKRLITLCAHPDALQKQTIAAQNYSLNDDAYNKSVEINPPSAGTFILYPRQVRFYLDQLYGKNGVEISVPVYMENLKTIFANCMATLGYKTRQGTYDFIPLKEAKNAFDQALEFIKFNDSSILNLSKIHEREQIFNLLEKAIDKLETNLETDFNETTETTLTK